MNTPDKKISFHFRSYKDNNNNFIIKKTHEGAPRRYVAGISSGIKMDGEGERLTQNCIKSLMNQYITKDILLHAGNHGESFDTDIGIMTDSDFVNNDTDWYTEYRLYDEMDNFPLETINKVSHIWKQLTGTLPYRQPHKRGFSIEGRVPEEAILSKQINRDGSYSKRVIDDIKLDCVLLCRQPAYLDSVATAVFKCLGELHPVAKEKIEKNINSLLKDEIEKSKNNQSFLVTYSRLCDLMEDHIIKIMGLNDRPEERLGLLFDEYKKEMINLVLHNPQAFATVPAENKNTQLESMFSNLLDLTRKLNSSFKLKGVIS